MNNGVWDEVWYISRNLPGACIDLTWVERHGSGRRIAQGEWEWVDFPSGCISHGPTLSIQDEDAQQIMNELWRLGFRPMDGAGTVAHAEATKGHLADLRKIAFHALKISND